MSDSLIYSFEDSLYKLVRVNTSAVGWLNITTLKDAVLVSIDEKTAIERLGAKPKPTLEAL